MTRIEAETQWIHVREHRTVLTAVVLDEASAIALLRADEMARALDAELFVVGVVPVRSWVEALLDPSTADSENAFATPIEEGIHSWSEAILGRTVRRDHVLIRKGGVVACILDMADELDAKLLVLGSSPVENHHRFRERTADDVIRRARRPVLIARSPTISSEVVAATDLSDPAYPALRHAADLGARFHASVTFLHNVDRTEVVEAEDGGRLPSGFVHRFDDEVERRRTELAQIAEGVDRSAETVVLTLEDTERAILQLSRLHNADLVVVGAHRRRRRTSVGRFLPRAGTAVSVARHAHASVLVVPLDSDRDPTEPPQTGRAA
jgi:nucleotide-binding universal stress UspA family protein